MLGPDSMADERTAGAQKSGGVRKKGGNLARTLDATLQPHVPPGKPGRPKGARNYDWTPEMDNQLAGLWQKYGPTKAKAVMRKRLLEFCPRDTTPREESVRNAVERRMVFLGLATGNSRNKPQLIPESNPEPNRPPKPNDIPNGAMPITGGRWSPLEVAALLGTLGADLMDESLVARTGHSLKAVHAKLRRLGYTVSELRSIAFTIEELSQMLQVTVEEVQSWRRKGWLLSTRRRITDVNLMAFLEEHHDAIAFANLPSHIRTFLMSLGYPAPEARTFHAAVKSILESVTGRKSRSRVPQTTGADPEQHADESGSSTTACTARVAKKISRWSELKKHPHQATSDAQLGCRGLDTYKLR